jgi:hypothetical protein
MQGITQAECSRLGVAPGNLLFPSEQPFAGTARHSAAQEQKLYFEMCTHKVLSMAENVMTVSSLQQATLHLVRNDKRCLEGNELCRTLPSARLFPEKPEAQLCTGALSQAGARLGPGCKQREKDSFYLFPPKVKICNITKLSTNGGGGTRGEVTAFDQHKLVCGVGKSRWYQLPG